MSNQVWILIAVVVIVAIIVAYQRSRQSQVQQTRDLRMGA
jgi:predicted negative regulator of RcsB-dependent stress response